MISSLIPAHLRKDWLLHLSGFLTWSIVSFLSLSGLEINLEYYLKVSGSVGFYILFAWVVASERGTYLIRNRILVSFQIMLVLPLIYGDENNIIPILLVLIAISKFLTVLSKSLVATSNSGSASKPSAVSTLKLSKSPS